MKRSLIVGLVVVLFGFPAEIHAATHTVNQVGTSFQPNDITIEAGDTVEWVHSSGIHTVTNGTGPTDPDVGLLFDEALDSANPLVTYTFDDPGDFPYFCRPHFVVGMTGVVHVMPPVGADEPVRTTTWSRIKKLYR